MYSRPLTRISPLSSMKNLKFLPSELPFRRLKSRFPLSNISSTSRSKSPKYSSFPNIFHVAEFSEIPEPYTNRQVELYVPRKCSASNRIIKAKDHASVQINIANVDEEGRAIAGSNTTYALSGYIRARGEADDSLNRLAQQDGLLKNVWSYSR